MKKTVTIKIEVDLDSEASRQWAKPNEFFIDEIDTVLEKLSSIRTREYSRYSSEEGQTEFGSKFKIAVKKIK